jgi:hypothetical protein
MACNAAAAAAPSGASSVNKSISQPTTVEAVMTATRCSQGRFLRKPGIDKGEPTARLAPEVGLSPKQLHALRLRIQANLNETVPTGTAFEADELHWNAGERSTSHLELGCAQ